MTPPVVRAARADEADLLAPIERAADQRYRAVGRPEFADGEGIPPDVARRYCDAGRVLVAELDGHVVGFLAWHIEEDDPTSVGVAQVSVGPQFGRRGIGSMLVDAVIGVALERGARSVVLATWLDVPWNEPWYRRLGFVVVPEANWTTRMRARVDAQEAEGLSWVRRVWMSLDLESLHGGVANAGAVVRVGHHVLRPSNEHSVTIHRLLRHVRERGFDGANEPVAIEGDHERLVFVAGDVATPPYPEWFQHDDALASTARLIRELHDASTDFDRSGATWSDELSDHLDGEVICHNDVCPENIVFRDGAAVALLDFDFAAPGRRAHDLAAFARMCVPVDDPTNATRIGWHPPDLPQRLRLVADAYGLSDAQRIELIECLDESIARGGEFVLRRVAAGEPAFIEMFESMGGVERFDRRRSWWAEHRHAFGAALT